jgi:general secretion pathway protein N
MTSRLILFLLIAGCLLLGAIVFVELEPSGANNPAIVEVTPPPELAPAMRRSQNPRPDELVATILARPLFSSTRRPPQSAPAGGSADADLADTRLTGIVTEPRRRVAIFAISGDKPLKVAEGDAVSGWRIESITPREVSLSGPSGTKTLQPKIDPNLGSPAGQPPIGPAGARLPTPSAPVAGRPPATAAAGQPNPTSLPVNNPGAARPPRVRQQR